MIARFLEGLGKAPGKRLNWTAENYRIITKTLKQVKRFWCRDVDFQGA
jgi:hypothetical protein